MKLNHDCIRKLLLYIEECLDFSEELDLSSFSLDDFSKNEIVYSAKKLNEAGYIVSTISEDVTGELNAVVSDITWEGHKFLDTIRDNQVWSTTKKILSKVSSASITFVSNVASQVLKNIINQQFGITGSNFS